MGPSERSPTILYVVSHSHSGSTLLELLVGGHSAVASLGEVKWLDRGLELRYEMT